MIYFLTVIGFKKKDLERINGVVQDIWRKDKSFIWSINTSKFEKYDYVLRIRSEDNDIAHKRGTLLVKRYFADLNLQYWVKEVK